MLIVHLQYYLMSVWLFPSSMTVFGLTISNSNSSLVSLLISSVGYIMVDFHVLHSQILVHHICCHIQ